MFEESPLLLPVYNSLESIIVRFDDWLGFRNSCNINSEMIGKEKNELSGTFEKKKEILPKCRDKIYISFLLL